MKKIISLSDIQRILSKRGEISKVVKATGLSYWRINNAVKGRTDPPYSVVEKISDVITENKIGNEKEPECENSQE